MKSRANRYQRSGQALATLLPLLLLALSLPSSRAPAAASGPAPAAANPASIRLTLPPAIYAVPGVEMNLYFGNLILAETAEPFSFAVTCDIGETDALRWRLLASPGQAGTHDLSLKVSSKAGRLLARASTKVHVIPADAGSGRQIVLLIVGDSLTHASHYPNELARLLAGPGNPKWRMLGTHHPASAAANVFHEGYGGWTWRAFNSRFDPAPPPPGKTTRSPFVFPTGVQQEPQLDLPRYLAERCGGTAPDVVTFLLGINDCFRLRANDPQAVDQGIDDMFREADKLLGAFRKAAPRAQLGVCLATPPNLRDGAFVANYKAAHPRWNWRQVQHRIVERQIEHFGQRERENIFLVPTELNLDVVGGYPDNNAVHPNPEGYRQIGATIYSWLKARLAATDRPQ